jgi:hypothetical protein
MFLSLGAPCFRFVFSAGFATSLEQTHMLVITMLSVQDSSGSSCVMPLDPYQKMAMSSLTPLLFVAEVRTRGSVRQRFIRVACSFRLDIGAAIAALRFRRFALVLSVLSWLTPIRISVCCAHFDELVIVAADRDGPADLLVPSHRW